MLDGQLGGGSLNVENASNGLNSVGSYVLDGGQSAIWSYVAPSQDTPQIGNIGPTLGRADDVVAVTGANFGNSIGSIAVGGQPADISYWSATEVDFVVPNSAMPGVQKVILTAANSGVSNSISYQVLSGSQTATTFSVTGTSTSFGDQIYLSGNIPELGNWNTDSSVAIGPMLCPDYPTWFILASVPAGKSIQYKFFIKKADGSIQWEPGGNHQYLVPSEGTGTVSVAW